MPSRKELDACYMQCAEAHAALSKADRKKVGAVLITNTGIVVPGYNGTPAGTDNTCEHIPFVLPQLLMDGTDTSVQAAPVTKPEVIHAELNCILKAAKEGVSVEGSKIYITLSPCMPCAAMLLQAGVTEVIYKETYRALDGVQYLLDNRVQVRKVEE